MSCIVAHPAKAPPGEAVACRECIEARDVRLARYEVLSTRREAELGALREVWRVALRVSAAGDGSLLMFQLDDALGAVDATRKGMTT